MEKKSFEDRLYALRNELCPNCAGTPCWQCKFNIEDVYEDRTCIFGFIIEAAHDGEY